jgi:hypothetical protein
MNPGQVAIAPSKMVKLRLLTNPENAEREKTHKIGKEIWQKIDQSTP